MRYFPENYQRLHASNHNRPHVRHMINANLSSIKMQVEKLQDNPQADEKIKCFSEHVGRLMTFLNRESISADDLDYLGELLVRVNCYIETKGANEENNTQLNMLLNHKVAGYLDRDVMDALFYGVGCVLMASTVLLAVVGAVVFAMANMPMTMIILPSVMLLGMGVACLGSDQQEEGLEAIIFGASFLIVGLILAPDLFFLAVGAYLAASAVLFGGAYGASVCATNTSLATHTYTLKSDVNALMTSGFFGGDRSEQNKSADDVHAEADLPEATMNA